MRNSVLLFCILLCSIKSISQQAGQNIYSFLSLPIPARTASLGGAVISIKDEDLNLGLQNPALLNLGMKNQLSFSHVNFISDINFLNVAYGNSIQNFGNYALSLQKVGYGQFLETNEYGEITGSFRADDYSFNMSICRDLDSNFSYGFTLKSIYSKYYNYTSFGNALDAGITYHNKKKQFTASAVIRNFGYQWKTYTANNREKLPQEIMVSVSKKVAKAPFRLLFYMGNLQQWDLTYSDNLTVQSSFSNADTSAAKNESRFRKIGDNFLRHVIIGNEFILTKNFNLRIAFDFRKQKEFKLIDKSTVSGLSFGFGIKISKFHFSYGFTKYHAAGNANHFTVTTNLSSFQKKNKTQ